VVEGIFRKPTTTEITTIGIKTYRHAVKMSTVPSAGGTVSSGDLAVSNGNTDNTYDAA
jgi:hypothetical protein